MNFAATEYRSNPLLAVLGVAGLLCGILYAASERHLSDEEAAIAMVIGLVGMVFIFMFYQTRRSVLAVRAGSGEMLEQVKGTGLDAAIQFIQAVEDAKRRFEETRQNPGPPSIAAAGSPELETADLD